MVLPLLTRIDHVGIACRDLAKSIELYRVTFGLEVVSLESNEEQGVREAMLAVGPGTGGCRRLGPGATSSCSSRWGRTRRWASSWPAAARGIHHIGYGVTNITEAMAAISAGSASG